MKKFRFYIDGQLVHPSYKMTQARLWTQEAGQAFYRPSLTDPFTILSPDYEIIKNQDTEHEFSFLCQELTSTSPITWTDFFKGYFTKHDIEEFDEDHKLIRLKPLPDDDYRKLLDGLEKEFNIIDLGIEKSIIKYERFPVLQFYFEGFNSSRVWNYSGSSFWESDTSERYIQTSRQQLVDSGFHPWFFNGEDQSLRKRFINVYGTGLTTDVTGLYEIETYPGSPNDPEDPNGGNTLVNWRRTDGAFRLSASLSPTTGQEVNWQLKTSDNTQFLFWNSTAPASSGQEDPSGNILKMFGDDTNAPGEVIQLESYKIMYRRITNNVEVLPAAVEKIPEDNLIESFGRTHFVINSTVAIDDATIILSRTHSVSVNIFGKVVEPAIQYIGMYYRKPTSPSDYIPSVKSLWNDTAIWILISPLLKAGLGVFNETIILKDAYRLDRVINALAKAIDPVLVHGQSTLFSDFLYNVSNPMTGFAQGSYYLTAKGNIIKPDYDKAATKVIVKLKDLLRALNLMFYGLQYDIRDFSGAKWVRLEHEYFYDRGKSYSSDLIGADLTSIVEPHTMKPWDFNAKKWSSEKPDIPGYIKRTWPDDVSDFFNGTEIEVLSKYAEKEQRDEEPIPLITTDLDYISANTTGVSQTGLVMLEVVVATAKVVEIEYYNAAIQVTQIFQNGSLAMPVLQERFGRYQLPAKNVKMNGSVTTALSVTRTRKQNLRLKVNQYLDVGKLILTSLGKGRIQSLREVMRTGENQITVKHHPEP